METVLEINLQHLAHNYHFLRAKLKPTTKFLGVVKAFAYGSDAMQIAKKLEALGVDYLAVAYANEGVQLREAGITVPILVLHPQVINFEVLIKHRLTPSLYAAKVLKAFVEVAKKMMLDQYPVHLKFNTGLNRLGFLDTDITLVSKLLKDQNYIKVEGVFSHLAASDDANEREFTEAQISSFQNILSDLDKELGICPIKHLLNTSGIINYPDAQLDMVRSGIGMYGFGNTSLIDTQLKPIATLKTSISQIHTIKPGQTVGYNRAFVAEANKKTATLPLGHADGIGRQYGNGNSYVVIHGQKAPIVGNVCMDMIMVDVTNVDCAEGDEVIIFGERNTAESLASTANTISYELLTGISQRVKRTFIM